MFCRMLHPQQNDNEKNRTIPLHMATLHMFHLRFVPPTKTTRCMLCGNVFGCDVCNRHENDNAASLNYHYITLVHCAQVPTHVLAVLVWSELRHGIV